MTTLAIQQRRVPLPVGVDVQAALTAFSLLDGPICLIKRFQRGVDLATQGAGLIPLLPLFTCLFFGQRVVLPTAGAKDAGAAGLAVGGLRSALPSDAAEQ